MICESAARHHAGQRGVSGGECQDDPIAIGAVATQKVIFCQRAVEHFDGGLDDFKQLRRDEPLMAVANLKPCLQSPAIF